MRLTCNNMGHEYTAKVEPDEFGSVRVTVSNDLPEIAHIIFDQVAALSLARMIEEQVKDNRRR